jgi:hypothetical protein
VGGIVMKRFVFLGFVLFVGLPVFADADNVESISVETASSAANISLPAASKMPEGSSSKIMQAPIPEKKQDTPEEKAYKANMIKIDSTIAKKIEEIQTKQKEIDTEVYKASIPPLIAERVILETQLRELQMARDKMQTQESARKMTQDLKNNTSGSL